MSDPTLENKDAEPVLTHVVAEVGEATRHAQAMDSLLRELSHRSKNLLAIVLSIAAQTARHSETIDSFLEKFRGRILSLSAAQDLITESDWLGTPFRALVRGQMLRSSRLPRTDFRLVGDNPVLGPNAALHVGLAIHELITNAASHATSPGSIVVEAHLRRSEADASDLVIDWTEEHGPGPDPAAPEFGTLVLEEIVPRSLGGKARFILRADRVHYHLEVPADQFSV